MTTTSVHPSTGSAPVTKARLKINVFHCFNSLNSTESLEGEGYEVRSLKMPCSGMTREIFLLKAFEAGADAVVVLVCPEGSCGYLEGNIRARKRVERVKKLLDEAGVGGWRLNIHNIPRQDMATAEKIIRETASRLSAGGGSPAG